jgi:hypothetical protein
VLNRDAAEAKGFSEGEAIRHGLHAFTGGGMGEAHGGGTDGEAQGFRPGQVLVDAEEQTGGEGIAGTGGTLHETVGKLDAGLTVGCAGLFHADGTFNEMDGDGAAHALIQQRAGGVFNQGPGWTIVSADGEAGEFAGFDFIENEVVHMGKRTEGAAGEIGVFHADHIRRGDEAGGAGFFEDMGGTAAPIGTDGIEGVEEHEVAEVEKAGRDAGEIKVIRGQEGIGSALVELVLTALV